MPSRRRLIGRFVQVDVDGYRGPVHVREDGRPDAPALVLLHGFSGSMHWFGRVVPLLADSFRLIRVDLLGHGATGGPPADAPVQSRVVAAALAALGVEHATAVGHSFGADVAADLAENSPLVERLVIVCQAPDYSDAVLPRGNAIMTVPVLSTALHRAFQPVAAGLGALLGATRGHSGNRELARQALLDFGALNPGMFRVILVDRRERLARHPLDVEVRAAVDAGKDVAVILGGRDHFYGDRAAPRYRAAGARVEILPDNGHSPLVEAPGRTARLLRDLLVAVPG